MLIVDDQSAVRGLLTMLLSEGWEVAEASDGREGFERALDLLPDLVLTDLIMPGMDGIALVEALRERPELTNLPIIVLSGCGEARTRLSHCTLAGYLIKPEGFRNLPATVQEVLHRCAHSRAAANG